MKLKPCRLSLSALLGVLGLVPFGFGATRTVHVGLGGTKFVDAVSGNSTSNINTGDTIQWTWSAGFHSTTSGTCSSSCSPDGLWDSGEHGTPFSFSHTFSSDGTFTYYCTVHGTAMQGTVIVGPPPPAPTVTSVAPTSGPAGSGNAVSITGTNFVTGATVTVGGVAATGVSFVGATTLDATTPVLSPGTLNDVVVTNPDTQTGTLTQGWLADFLDVPQADIFHDDVGIIFRNKITAGCGGGNYCRNAAVSRAQMAVFLLKAKLSSSYVPPACAGIFADVACPSPFADWIEDLSNRGITTGCGGGNYCPDNPVTRQQMAVFLLRAHDGSAYTPPPCVGVFGDVPCTPGVGFPDWIEELYHRAITGGCQASPLLFCPTNANNRGQMAVFLVKTFGLTP